MLDLYYWKELEAFTDTMRTFGNEMKSTSKTCPFVRERQRLLNKDDKVFSEKNPRQACGTSIWLYSIKETTMRWEGRKQKRRSQVAYCRNLGVFDTNEDIYLCTYVYLKNIRVHSVQVVLPYAESEELSTYDVRADTLQEKITSFILQFKLVSESIRL